LVPLRANWEVGPLLIKFWIECLQRVDCLKPSHMS
jgi:hypothetical protein